VGYNLPPLRGLGLSKSHLSRREALQCFAEAIMKYYAIVELDITDQSWVPDYIQNVTKMVERHGGRYLARTPKVEKVEGERKPPQIIVLLEWPSRETAVAFYESDEYRPYLQSRLQGARNEFLLIAGEDSAQAAQTVA
jgi:uncharacterized protein (DUF1330 family)